MCYVVVHEVYTGSDYKYLKSVKVAYVAKDWAQAQHWRDIAESNNFSPYRYETWYVQEMILH